MKILKPVLIALVAANLLVAYSINAEEQKTMIAMTTSMGNITIELYPEQAPVSVENFLNYVNSDFFTDLVFHRVIPGFMIQGGGLNARLQDKPGNKPISNEADNGLLNNRGTIAMARTSSPHSATSQFFINLVDNDFLNHSEKSSRGWGYAVFGKVSSGMDVVDAIAKVATGNVGMHQNVPLKPVVIEKVEVIEDKPASL